MKPKITDIEFVTVGPIVINDDNSYFRVEKVYWEFIKSSEEKVNNNTNIHKTQNDINAFGKFISPVEGYNYNGFNYYSLRDLAVILNFDVSYDNVFLEIYNYGVMYEGYTELRNTPDEIESAYINKFCESYLGELISGLELETLNINGYNYFKLRDITNLLNYSCQWDESNNLITINK